MIAHVHYDQETLTSFALDRLGDDRDSIAGHIETCDICQRKLETLSCGDLSFDELGELLRSTDGPFLDEPVSPSRFGFLEPPEHPDSIGRFGRYEIKRILGRGGMGIVMQGYDSALERHCAIKVLAPELASSGSARSRFSREAKSAAAVVHPHVVAIQTVDEHDGLPFLVMPVVEGRSLQQRVDSDGALDAIEAVRIASQIARGLAAAHGQGLIHRDIKPANILLENGVERVQITDFGLARAADDASMTRSGVIAGTPQYMSPEQAHGDELDTRSDLFSLGSVIYFMLTGHSPFRAESTMGVLNRIGNDEPRTLRSIQPNVPQWLEHVVMRLLAKQPGDRYASAEEVAELLEECLAHLQQPTMTPLPVSLATAGSQRQSRPPFAKVLTAVGFAAVMLLASVVIVLELGKGTLRIESDSDDVPIRVMRGDEVFERLSVSQSGKSIRVSAGNYTVQLEGAPSELKVENQQVTLDFGGSATTRIVWDKASGKNAPSVADALTEFDESAKPNPHDSAVAMVAVSTQVHADVLYFAIDAAGKLLPSESFSKDDLQRYILIDAGSDYPTGNVGESFGVPRVADAAALADLLVRELDSKAIHKIIAVRTHQSRKSAESNSELTLELHNGHTIFWGRALGKEVTDEPSAKSKIETLRNAKDLTDINQLTRTTLRNAIPVPVENPIVNSLRSYSVAQLFSAEGRASGAVQLNRIRHNLMNSVVAQSWDDQANRIVLDVENSALLISQSVQGHKEIQAFLKSVATSDAEFQSESHEKSANNLLALVAAIHKYHEVNEHFPSQKILDGAPTMRQYAHSWRVAILPWLGHQDLFDQYRFHEPWNSDHNKTLISKMPDVYRAPLDAADSYNTSYFGIVSSGRPRTLFNPYSRTRFTDCTDGTSQSIALAEARRSIPWTKPEDITYAGDGPLPDFGGWFDGGFHAGMVDGRATFLDSKMPDNSLRSLITVNDGNHVSVDTVQNARFALQSDKHRQRVLSAEDIVSIRPWQYPREFSPASQSQPIGQGLAIELSVPASIKLRAAYSDALRQPDSAERFTLSFDGTELATAELSVFETKVNLNEVRFPNSRTTATPSDPPRLLLLATRGSDTNAHLYHHGSLTSPTITHDSHLDVNRDGKITPLDALSVIAHLNNTQSNEGDSATPVEPRVLGDAKEIVFSMPMTICVAGIRNHEKARELIAFLRRKILQRSIPTQAESENARGQAEAANSKPEVVATLDPHEIWKSSEVVESTDLIRFEDQWVCALQTPARLQLITSKDGADWKELYSIVPDDPKRPLQSPRLAVDPDGRLILSAVKRRISCGGDSVAWISDEALDSPQSIPGSDFLLSSVHVHNKTTYYTQHGSICGNAGLLRISSSEDGVKFRELYEDTPGNLWAADASLTISQDHAYCVSELFGKHRYGGLGISKAPYDKWKWTPLCKGLKNPNLILSDSGMLLVSAQLPDDAGRSRSVLCQLDSASSRLHRLAQLPTDESTFMGLANHGGQVFVTYHTRNGSESTVHLARASIKTLRFAITYALDADGLAPVVPVFDDSDINPLIFEPAESSIPVGSAPRNDMSGEVLAFNKEKWLVAISWQSDTELRKGHILTVSRSSKRIASIKVIHADGPRWICMRLRGTEGEEIEPGDRVEIERVNSESSSSNSAIFPSEN